jgi:hypothetical protein
MQAPGASQTPPDVECASDSGIIQPDKAAASGCTRSCSLPPSVPPTCLPCEKIAPSQKSNIHAGPLEVQTTCHTLTIDEKYKR